MFAVTGSRTGKETEEVLSMMLTMGGAVGWWWWGGGGGGIVLEGKKEEMRVLNQLIPKRPSEQQTKVLTNETSSRCSCPKVSQLPVRQVCQIDQIAPNL